MPVSDQWADRLTILAQDLRPHGARRWDAPGVLAHIRKVQHLNLGDVTMAVTRAACDRSLDTPAAISDLRSSAWRERVTEHTPSRPAICDTHGTQFHGGICPSCRADEIGIDTTKDP